MRFKQPLFVLVDMQTRLVPAMSGAEECVKRQAILLGACPHIDVPVFVTEQYPKGLGNTIEQLAELLPEDAKVFDKKSFSCFADTAFADAVAASGAKTIVLAGCETHVCVMQTALDAVERGYGCVVIADGVASRKDADRVLALETLRSKGVWILGSESWLFECLGTSAHPGFKAVSALIK